MSQYPYDEQSDEYPEVYGVIGAEKHSGLGIASFLLSLIASVLIVGAFVAAGVMAGSTSGELEEDSPAAMIIGFVIIGGGVLDIVALGLGIAGILQSKQKRVFAVLGLCLSTLMIVAPIALIIIGWLLG